MCLFPGATANAAKEHMLPFFQAVMEQLKVYLTSMNDGGDTLTLQVQSIGRSRKGKGYDMLKTSVLVYSISHSL